MVLRVVGVGFWYDQTLVWSFLLGWVSWNSFRGPSSRSGWGVFFTTVTAKNTLDNKNNKNNNNIKNKFDEALLEDMLPPPSEFCLSNYDSYVDKTSFTYVHSPSPSYWDPMNQRHEPETFLAEMSHSSGKTKVDEVNDGSWTIRLGPGGNLYSFRGRYGEAIPPQWHVNGAFVDEVQQSVCLNVHLNKFSGVQYFVHQAGTYARDPPYSNVLFFAPSLAHHCGDRVCMFGGWGQQANIPTIHESEILYFSAYRDCGGGILEVSSVIHNSGFAVDSPIMDYINIPWAGVRTSTLRDVFLSTREEQRLKLLYPAPDFFDGTRQPNNLLLRQTGGYITFAERVVVPPALFRDHYELPCVDLRQKKNVQCHPGITHTGNGRFQRVRLVVGRSFSIQMSQGHSTQFRRNCVTMPIQPTAVETQGCLNCNLWLTNGRTNFRVHVMVVVHWAWDGNLLFFCPEAPTTAHQLNFEFRQNDEILVSHANIGKEFSENAALTFVHGLEHAGVEQRWSANRLKFGIAGDHRRDYTINTLNARINIQPGDTYVYRQFMINGRLDQVEATAPPLVDHVYEDLLSPGDMTGRAVHLVISGTDTSSFGIDFDVVEVEGDTPASRRSRSACHDRGCRTCSGRTVPTFNHTRLFAVVCDDRHFYVGSDPYHFAPPQPNRRTDKLRSYVCHVDGQLLPLHRRPTWKLLGFFEEGSCDVLKRASYDPDFCQRTDIAPCPSSVPTSSPIEPFTNRPTPQPITHVPTTTPTDAATTLPSTTPSDRPSRVHSTDPTHAPTAMPSNAATTLPSTTPSVQPSRVHSFDPTRRPSLVPSVTGSSVPSSPPSTVGSDVPTQSPRPSVLPSHTPSHSPVPTPLPSHEPFTFSPTTSTSVRPTVSSSMLPVTPPSIQPSSFVSSSPSSVGDDDKRTPPPTRLTVTTTHPTTTTTTTTTLAPFVDDFWIVTHTPTQHPPPTTPPRRTNFPSWKEATTTPPQSQPQSQPQPQPPSPFTSFTNFPSWKETPQPPKGTPTAVTNYPSWMEDTPSPTAIQTNLKWTVYPSYIVPTKTPTTKQQRRKRRRKPGAKVVIRKQRNPKNKRTYPNVDPLLLYEYRDGENVDTSK